LLFLPIGLSAGGMVGRKVAVIESLVYNRHGEGAERVLAKAGKQSQVK